MVDRIIPIARPLVGDDEIVAVAAVLRSGELAQGRWVADFECAFAEFCGVSYAIATSSGTTALQLALLAHAIGPGDEVITTAFTFIASSNAILHVGARPVFGDIEADTFNLDPESVECLITPRTKAILAVDLYGHPADLVRMQELCTRHGIALIEDASQAHGAAIGDRRFGHVRDRLFLLLSHQEYDDGRGWNDHDRLPRSRQDRPPASSTRIRRDVPPRLARVQFPNDERASRDRFAAAQALGGVQ